jgi:hypothetical protein
MTEGHQMRDFDPYLKCIVAASLTSQHGNSACIVEMGSYESLRTTDFLPCCLPARTGEHSPYSSKAGCHVIFKSFR